MTKNRMKLFAFLTVLVLVTMACATLNNTNNAGGNDSVSAPVVDDSILFSDDFSDSSTGWDQYADEDGSTDYADGVYRINVTNSTQIFWANPGKSYTDIRVEVDASLVDGEMDNSFGIICRHANIDNFYALMVSSDGYYAIRKRVDGSQLDIISGESGSYEFSESIPQGNVTVRLAAECVGDALRLYVNDILLVEVIDGDISGGDVGLMATTFDAVHTTIEFDNFVVLKP